MTRHPITLASARGHASAWFKNLQQHITTLPEDHPVQLQGFVETACPEFERSKKGDPHYTQLVKAMQGKDFVILAVVLTEGSGSNEMHNPLLYITERVAVRPRPSGWGATQPYGKRIDKDDIKCIPEPKTKQIIDNLLARIEQMANGSQHVTPAPAADTPKTVVPGVHIYPYDREPGLLLHIPVRPVTPAQADAIVNILRA